jgi:hypothetical protein
MARGFEGLEANFGQKNQEEKGVFLTSLDPDSCRKEAGGLGGLVIPPEINVGFPPTYSDLHCHC